MRDTCETIDVVMVANPENGLVTINKSDYNPELHLVEGETPAPKKRGRPKKVKES